MKRALFLLTVAFVSASMRYLQLAAGLLRTSADGLAEIAYRVGYESEAAFSRAFRRHLGQPPARWREAGRVARP